MYDVWILDEISMIPTQHFEHMMRQWLLAGRWPILIFVGDFGQLPPIGLDTNADARQSPLWRQVARHDLGCRTNFRAQDTRLLNFQELVRSSMPTAQQLELFSEDIFLGSTVDPAALESLWRQCPGVHILCATKRMENYINTCAAAYFGGPSVQALGVWGEAEVKSMPIFEEARVRLTQTLSLEDGWVNGARGCVGAVADAGLMTHWEDGSVSFVWPVTRKLVSAAGKVYLQTAFPVALAYASTVHQVQGQSLDDVCVVFEEFAPPGWAYTALTRARFYTRLRFLGAISPDHFRPR